MNFDELTLGQIKQIKAMFGGGDVVSGGCECPPGRYVLVLDRGWIFAGDLGKTPDGYVKLTKAVHVFKWEGIGFAKMIEEWKSSKVDIRPCADVETPSEAVLFRIPVSKDWGIK